MREAGTSSTGARSMRTRRRQRPAAARARRRRRRRGRDRRAGRTAPPSWSIAIRSGSWPPLLAADCRVAITPAGRWRDVAVEQDHAAPPPGMREERGARIPQRAAGRTASAARPPAGSSAAAGRTPATTRTERVRVVRLGLHLAAFHVAREYLPAVSQMTTTLLVSRGPAAPSRRRSVGQTAQSI